MIEAAAVLSVVVRPWADFVIILVLLLANTIVGFREEDKADKTIAELKAKLALMARVKRDGVWTSAAGQRALTAFSGSRSLCAAQG